MYVRLETLKAPPCPAQHPVDLTIKIEPCDFGGAFREMFAGSVLKPFGVQIDDQSRHKSWKASPVMMLCIGRNLGLDICSRSFRGSVRAVLPLKNVDGNHAEGVVRPRFSPVAITKQIWSSRTGTLINICKRSSPDLYPRPIQSECAEFEANRKTRVVAAAALKVASRDDDDGSILELQLIVIFACPSIGRAPKG